MFCFGIPETEMAVRPNVNQFVWLRSKGHGVEAEITQLEISPNVG